MGLSRSSHLTGMAYHWLLSHWVLPYLPQYRYVCKLPAGRSEADACFLAPENLVAFLLKTAMLSGHSP